MKTKLDNREKRNRFVEDAREMGLDTDEANAEFERAFGKIVPPKKKGDAAGNQGQEAPTTKHSRNAGSSSVFPTNRGFV